MTTRTLVDGSKVAGGPLHYVVVGLLLVICLAVCVRVVDEKRPRLDGKSNLASAYNLYSSGTFSHARRESVRPYPTNAREPLYPFLVAGAFWVLAGGQPIGMACVLEPDPDCDEIVERLKTVDVALMVMLALLTYLAAVALFGPGWLSVGALALFVVHPSLYFYANNFRTEIPAALFLLAHAYFTYRLVKAPERISWAILSGLALSMLVLTKAIFMFYPVAIVVFLLGHRLLRRTRRITAFKGMIVACAIALLTIGLWTGRNIIVVDQYLFSGRGGGILTLRAEYSTMSLPQYAAAIVYYTPYYGKKLARKLLKPELYALLDRKNPEGYYLRRHNNGGVVVSRRHRYPPGTRLVYYRAALSVLAENWAMHLALTPVFAYRGAGIPINYHGSKGFERLAKPIRTFSKFVSMLFFPAMLFVLIVTVSRRNWHVLVFFLPAFFSIAAYAFLSHYHTRYSLPLVPHLVLALAWTAQAILARLAARPNRAGPSQGDSSKLASGRVH